MRILVVGSGGRECALANMLLLSKQVSRVYMSEANLGVYDPHVPSGFGQVLDGKYSARVRFLHIPFTEKDEMGSVIEKEHIELVVIGPEAPLADGLADFLVRRGVKVIGPTKKCAKLESSKIYAKKFMKKYEIPTPDFKAFTSSEVDKAVEYGSSLPYPVAVKADGLCGGKGVVIAAGKRELKSALDSMLVKKTFGEEGAKVVVEEGLTGKEISFIGLFDGETYVPFPPATDFKRQLDRDAGPNTGGMGSIAPSPYATPEAINAFNTAVLPRFIEGARAEELDYCGFIYFGCMLTGAGLKVLEFNVRMGDPEAQAILPLLKSDLSALLDLCAIKRLVRAKPSWSKEHVVAVVLASEKYPAGKSQPAPITGLEKIPLINQRFAPKPAEQDETTLMLHPFRMPPLSVFFSGVSLGEPTKTHVEKKLQPLYATGGRVLTVSARGATLSDARKLAYDAAGNVKWKGMQYRKDIGKIR